MKISYSDAARILGTGLISTGVGLLLFVIVTVAWGDPFTKALASHEQDQLETSLGDRVDVDFAAGATATAAGPPDARLTRAAAFAYRKSTPNGDAAAKINIPRIDMDRFVVRGTGVPDLKKGPGFYMERPTGFPGMGQPVAIAGHRTTHGAPFLHVDKLKRGDKIVLTLPYGRFEYKVVRTKIIEPDDWSVIEYGIAYGEKAQRRALKAVPGGASPSGRSCPGGTCEHLVLTACHPKYSAAKRLAVFAVLDKVQLPANEGRKGSSKKTPQRRAA